MTAAAPVRAMLLPQSSLLPAVREGLQALENAHRPYVDDELRGTFADSLDLDTALQPGREQENRWDYLLGHEPSGAVVGLEPHSAKNDEVSTVIAKRRCALDQLKGHVKTGAKVAAWFWVASGKVDFLPMDKKVLLLDQNGITFVGKKLLGKHLTKLPPSQLSAGSSKKAQPKTPGKKKSSR